MQQKIVLLLWCVFGGSLCYAQKIDVDSLLMAGLNSYRAQAYEQAIQQGQLGVSLAPDYYDFHMLLGRSFLKTGQLVKAANYFDEVMQKAPVYKGAFTHAIQLKIKADEYEQAVVLVDKAIAAHPKEKQFYLTKLKLMYGSQDEHQRLRYLQELNARFPGDPSLLKAQKEAARQNSSMRVGVDHSYSTFNREGAGPWHITGIQFLWERKRMTLVGRLNYTDRRGGGSSLRSGLQYGVDAYIKGGQKAVHYLNGRFSGDAVFPSRQLSYSYYQGHKKGWETEIGGRYIHTSTGTDLYTAIAGLGKYFGSSWINARGFLFFDDEESFPAFAISYRYYFGGQFDYVGLISGYGTAPDESTNLSPFDQRASLDSYRIGLAYSKILGDNPIIGAQLIYNRQEYVVGRKQNQLDLFLSLQFKL